MMAKFTKLTQVVEVKGQNKSANFTVLPFGRSKAIEKLKTIIAFPGEFFYELNKNGQATFRRDIVTISFQIEEIDETEVRRLQKEGMTQRENVTHSSRGEIQTH